MISEEKWEINSTKQERRRKREKQERISQVTINWKQEKPRSNKKGILYICVNIYIYIYKTLDQVRNKSIKIVIPAKKWYKKRGSKYTNEILK